MIWEQSALDVHQVQMTPSTSPCHVLGSPPVHAFVAQMDEMAALAQASLQRDESHAGRVDAQLTPPVSAGKRHRPA